MRSWFGKRKFICGLLVGLLVVGAGLALPAFFGQHWAGVTEGSSSKVAQGYSTSEGALLTIKNQDTNADLTGGQSDPATQGSPQPTDPTGPAAQGSPQPTDSAAEQTHPPALPPTIPSDQQTTPTCTISITCSTILDNMDKLNPDKKDIIPKDGVIFPPTKVALEKNDSVFTVLKRETKRAKIHMEFTNTPIYNSAYIEGIHNIYEFECGSLSGWVYKVNGVAPNYGSSNYILKDGDVIEWAYTCNLGKDVGGSNFNEQ